ncbi:preprotein translocase subunit SecA [Mycoplasmopsis californica]|uniref:Protein translocase subunit SecA n=1 Tax=Mycoplasmopsis equigenitalium TaxID=114883 RepID=A0ABY5J1Y9_9BACT|nr:preprotein translocase subunit SecA [Mycoplasmopsis equigenitalium]UUD36783.1 preprotein translocase subunit SecA [Mycoplasmopsis equigenitalium]VEU69918.1 preprotein translocase subunit SecA [Mycoplasmopsis californica]
MNLKNLFKFKSTEMRIAERTLTKINREWEKIKTLSDDELKNKTNEFRDRIQKGESLESLRPEAFAVCREATKRVMNKTPYDVQMIGGVLLDLGSVAEMKTGEGKTITSIAPIYLNALDGGGVIVSTVNEYLAERDATEMGEVFTWLGLTVGINKAMMPAHLKREAYAKDITYSIHSELGFDYLRDNMVLNIEEKVQRGLNFCLIDEVDSILIDEAKTPLIISGGQGASSDMYLAADQFVRLLTEEDYEIDDESKAVALTHQGMAKANKFYHIKNLFDIENSEIVHRVQNALRAHKVMSNNVEYIISSENKIELVDAFTGRVMEGRAYSEGLQQALQAKEMLEIEPETKTLATITYQNFFRMFTKLCGMTGTAKTEEQEFIDIYNMRVNCVPTNRPVIREDAKDVIFANANAKWKAIVTEIKRLYEKKQPTLVGTAQIEDSERLHAMLVRENIPHTVLNAKQNKYEAEIIARAGELGAITIATNMAGRGTDIKLADGAVELGGLYVLGTDKAESRRIDNQLRGRSGRQGDPGISRFFLSLEDNLIKRFAQAEAWKKGFESYGDNEITDKTAHLLFNMAQKKIEGFNYDNRKMVLNYDDVIRQQRDLIYNQRDIIISSVEVFEKNPIVHRMIINTFTSIIKGTKFLIQNGSFDYEKFVSFVNANFLFHVNEKLDLQKTLHFHHSDLSDYICEFMDKAYIEVAQKVIANFDARLLLNTEKRTIIEILDAKWQDHINAMDKLRSNINLVQYAQKNPYQIYTDQGSQMFEELIRDIAYNTVATLFNNNLAREIESPYKDVPEFEKIKATHPYTELGNYFKMEKWINIYNLYLNKKHVLTQTRIAQNNQENSTKSVELSKKELEFLDNILTAEDPFRYVFDYELKEERERDLKRANDNK